jgi:phosphatidate cytidylyltransferase
VKSTLQKRTLTGAVFGLVMTVGTLAHPITHHLLYAAICAACLVEFSGLLFSAETAHRLLRRSLLFVAGFLPTAFVLFAHIWSGPADFGGMGSMADFFGLGNLAKVLDLMKKLPAFFFALYALLPMVLLLVELFLPEEKGFEHLGKYMTGLVYLGLPLVLPHLISEWYEGFQPLLMMGILWMVWTSDTSAYLIGSRIGRTKLFPRISPNKTWEGTVGGVVLSAAVGLLLGFVMPLLGFDELSVPVWVGLGLICGVFGTLGDLLESMLKRNLGVKDSGGLLPGHGGFLDRFDALVLVLPFAVLYLFIV